MRVARRVLLTVALASSTTLGLQAPATGGDPCGEWEYVRVGARNAGDNDWAIGQGVQGRSTVWDRDDNMGCVADGHVVYTGTRYSIRLVDADGTPLNSYIQVGWESLCGPVTEHDPQCSNFNVIAIFGHYFLTAGGTQGFRCWAPCNNNRRVVDEHDWIALQGGFKDGNLCYFRAYRDQTPQPPGADHWFPQFKCNGGDGQWKTIIDTADTSYFNAGSGRGRPLVVTYRTGGEATGMKDDPNTLKYWSSGAWSDWHDNQCASDTTTNWDHDRSSDTSYVLNRVPSDPTPTC